jgi:adenylate kinase family enzyme
VAKRLVHRSDDTEEAMAKRIEQYHKNVEAVKGSAYDILILLL